MIPLTEEEAQRAAEYQMSILSDPEYIEEKIAADEKFKEQSFGACLGVVVVFFVVTLLSIVLISIASHKKKGHLFTASAPVEQSVGSPSDLFPQVLGSLNKGAVSNISSPGNNTKIYHCSYGDQLQVYALPTPEVTNQSLISFRLIVSAVTVQTTPPLVSQEVHTKNAYYDIIGANGGLVGESTQRLISTISR